MSNINRSNEIALALIKALLAEGLKVVALDETADRLSSDEQTAGFIDVLLTVTRNDPSRTVALNFFHDPEMTDPQLEIYSDIDSDPLIDFQGTPDVLLNSMVNWLRNQSFHPNLL